MVRRIKTGKRRGVLKYMVFTKDEKPVNLLNLQGSRGGFTEIDDEVAAVLAFVISSATFLAAQDDETGRCPKAVCKSLITRGS